MPNSMNMTIGGYPNHNKAVVAALKPQKNGFDLKKQEYSSTRSFPTESEIAPERFADDNRSCVPTSPDFPSKRYIFKSGADTVLRRRTDANFEACRIAGWDAFLFGT
jgi:hypothetical protein